MNDSNAEAANSTSTHSVLFDVDENNMTKIQEMPNVVIKDSVLSDNAAVNNKPFTKLLVSNKSNSIKLLELNKQQKGIDELLQDIFQQASKESFQNVVLLFLSEETFASAASLLAMVQPCV